MYVIFWSKSRVWCQVVRDCVYAKQVCVDVYTAAPRSFVQLGTGGIACTHHDECTYIMNIFNAYSISLCKSETWNNWDTYLRAAAARDNGKNWRAIKLTTMLILTDAYSNISLSQLVNISLCIHIRTLIWNPLHRPAQLKNKKKRKHVTQLWPQRKSGQSCIARWMIIVLGYFIGTFEFWPRLSAPHTHSTTTNV